MYSTLIEVIGLACLVVMAALLGGAPAAFGTAGISLLFVGASTDDSALGRNVKRVAVLPLRGVLSVRRSWRSRGARKLISSLSEE